MKNLHTLNKTGQPLELCLRSINPEDAIILIEDGVYNLLTASERLNTCTVYVLHPDAMARGVKYPEPFTSIDYIEFVKLTSQYDKVLSWY